MDDAISRQAVLKLLSTMPPEEAITKAMLIQNVKYMSAAQPEKRTEERTEKHACDCISRQAAIDALDEIRHALWEIDIPSPTVPEYIEHHEQIQSVWKLLDKKQKELYVLPSAQPEEASMILGASKDGVRLWYQCSACGEPVNADDNYCCNCGRKFING